MVKNNLLGKSIVYIGVNADDIDKVINTLDSAKIEFNGTYTDGQDIFCHEQAIGTAQMIHTHEKYKCIPPDKEQEIAEGIYNELNDRTYEKYNVNIFDDDYIESIENKHLKKFMTREEDN